VSESKLKQSGVPAWVVTFADLMTLLMCFFVLLFSMSQLDVKKYDTVASAISSAFGGKLPVTPSITPSLNSPVNPLNLLQAPITTNISSDVAGIDSYMLDQPTSPTKAEIQAQENYSELNKALEREQNSGIIEVQESKGKVIIRFQGTVAFYAGSANLAPNFTPILKNIAQTLNTVPGQLIVSGHTDNRPITTRQFRSNWDLSTARAATVVHYLINNTDIDPNRITAQGHADTRPLTSNATETGREKNRRVEIILSSAGEE
jgi:chemotaxis protein MotB